MACGRGNSWSECLILALKNPLLPKTDQKWKTRWVSRNEFFVLDTFSCRCFVNRNRFSYFILFVRVIAIPLPYRLQRVEAALVTPCRVGWFG